MDVIHDFVVLDKLNPHIMRQSLLNTREKPVSFKKHDALTMRLAWRSGIMQGRENNPFLLKEASLMRPI